jgi:hypothetical protein
MNRLWLKKTLGNSEAGEKVRSSTYSIQFL